MSTIKYDKIQKMTAVLLIFLFVLVCQCQTALASSVEQAQVRSAPMRTVSAAKNGMVRVYLSSLGNPSSLDLTIEGNYSLNHNGQFIPDGSRLNVAFSSANGEIRVSYNGQTYHVGKSFSLRRHSAGGTNGIYIAQARESRNPYPGDLSFEAVYENGGYTLYTIAHIYIENYLYGVLPYEMGNSSGMEALKAQAVAARTYTVRMMEKRASGRYDVKDTTSDQVYRGTPSGNANCVSAVDSTKGIVLMYNSDFITTYYSASNGGQTEIYRSGSSYAYMKVKDDPFDYANASSTVKKKVLYTDLTSFSNPSGLVSLLQGKAIASLIRLGYPANAANTTLKTLKSVTPHTPMYASPSRLYTKIDFTFTVSTYNAAGRAALVTLTETCGIFTELESLLGMGIQSLQNELWTVRESGSSFVLEARRYGHGMGMSQRGAMQMAKLGYTYDQILGFYYDGCTRVRHSFTNRILSASTTEQEIIVEQPAEIEQNQSYACQGTVVLTGNSGLLAIRSAASSSAAVLGAAGNGAIVEVLARVSGWYQIRFGELVGYVPASALTITGTPEGQLEEVSSILGFATVTANDYVNLRANGSLSGRILGSAPSGAVLTVFSKNGSWAKVQYQSTTAYASTSYLTAVSSQYPSDNLSSGSSTAKVATAYGTQTVNLRKTASTTAELVDVLQVGTVVTVLSDDGTWCRIACDSGEGYMLAEFLVYINQDESSFETDSEQADNFAQPDTNAGGTISAVVNIQQGYLNLRAEPSTDGRILTTIPKGVRVDVLARGTEWSAVHYNGFEGYANTGFLLFGITNENTSSNGSDPSDISSAVVVTPGGNLNLRQYPSTTSAVIAQIPPYSIVTVLDRGGSWSWVDYMGNSGYVMNSFLSFTENDTEKDQADDETASDTQTDSMGKSAVVSSNGGNVNLRRGPGMDDDVFASVPNGTVVEVKSQKGNWSLVRCNGLEGYMITSYLDFDGVDDANGTAQVKKAWVATDGYLNLRSAPNGNSQILTTIPSSTQVDVLASDIEWTQIRWNGHTGYVMSRFLSNEKPADQSPDTPSGDTNSVDGIAPEEPPVEPYVNIAGVVLDTSLESPAVPMDALVVENTALYPMCTQQNAILDVMAGEMVEILLVGERWCRIAYLDQQGYCPTNHLNVR